MSININHHTNEIGVSGAGVTTIPPVATYAALRLMQPASGQKTSVVSGSGGIDGDFYAVTGAAAGTYVDNGGTIIVPTGGDGSAAWLRDYSGAVNVRWFGAAGDGTADDTTAIQSSINAAGSNGQVLLPTPSSSYRCNSGITLGGGVSLVGQGKRLPSMTFYTGVATPAITVSTSYYSRISNIRIRHGLKASSGTCIFGDGGGGGGSAAYAQVDNVVIDSFSTGVRFIGEFTWLRFDDVHCVNCGAGFSFQSVNLPILNNCITDQTDGVGFYFDGVTTPQLNGCTAQYSGLVTSTSAAIDMSNTASAVISGCWFEGNHGDSIYLHGNSSYSSILSNVFTNSGNVSGVGNHIKISGTTTDTTVDGAFFYQVASSDVYIDATTSRSSTSNLKKATALLITDLASDTCQFMNGTSRGLRLGNVTSTDSKTLDWYEEGSFTPVIEGSTSAGVGTYTNQIGRFTRVGNTVYFRITLDWTAHTGTGNIIVTSLPYAHSAVGYSPVNIVSSNLTFSGALKAYVVQGNALIYLLSETSGGGLANVGIDTAATVHIAGTYSV